MSDLPSFGKIGPVAHHAFGQRNFLTVVISGFVERITKDKSNFIAMQYPSPSWPRVIGGPLVEIVKVNVIARLCKPMCKIYHWAREGIVSHHAVQRVSIFTRVRG